jgi:hypothetical protein
MVIIPMLALAQCPPLQTLLSGAPAEATVSTETR